MEVKKAISIAKEYIIDVFQDEGVFNVGLEEVNFNESQWDVTIGFSRKWDRVPPSPFLSARVGVDPDMRSIARTYKIVEVDDINEKVIGIRNRSLIK